MKTTHLKNLLLVSLIGVSLSVSANAVTIQLDKLAASYVGMIQEGGGNPTDEAGFINYLRGMPSPSGPTTSVGQKYTRSSNFGFPNSLPVATFNYKVEATNNETVPNLVFTVSGYILGKYGGAGEVDGKASYVWYVGAGTYNIDDFRGGLSHVSVFGGGTPPPGSNVADGGTSIVLLGLALCSLAFIRRKLA